MTNSFNKKSILKLHITNMFKNNVRKNTVKCRTGRDSCASDHDDLQGVE